MTPDHGPLLYEGKAKRVFSSDQANMVFVEFKNDTTAFNSLKRAELENKGRLNCQISACLFELLEKEGVPTHYQALAAENWMMVELVEVIPLEVVLRNVAAGSLCKQTPIAEGTVLSPALFDLYFKDDNLGDPLLTEDRLERMGLVTVEQRRHIEKLARRVNTVLTSFLERLDLTLVDFKLELGFNQAGALVVADEISPDTCRLWDMRITDPQDRILDKDRFRKDLGGVVEAYGEIHKRVQEACSKPRNYN
ncbi:phosphoribosylaminoimidazolesuccinocarboxamide synthase [Prochlorococcus sp. MIT 1300]|uniref:phosphoribosylaminoimidazolesuccinocarboxamide synthase n=1 Tax=Prochlorococcus sp. MIT 1300 TaxID=3096218 RepID=UPI002A74DAD2|nr:phosphoribosylaminoimidazolesuccinocarboxamide synthase [Prochlorococcus sp. MIT 1300]